MTLVVKLNGGIAKSCKFVDIFHLSLHHFFTIQKRIPSTISIRISFYFLPPPSFEPALLVLLPSFLPFILSVICPILLYHPNMILFLQISYPTDFRSSNSTDGLGSAIRSLHSRSRRRTLPPHRPPEAEVPPVFARGSP